MESKNWFVGCEHGEAGKEDSHACAGVVKFEYCMLGPVVVSRMMGDIVMGVGRKCVDWLKLTRRGMMVIHHTKPASTLHIILKFGCYLF